MKRIPIAIVGLKFGSLIIKQLQQKPASRFFEITAVCDLDRAKAYKLARELGVKASHDMNALLSDRNIAAIGLFTGPIRKAEPWLRFVRIS